MLSNLSHQELRKLYNESSLMIMPSLFEGLPKVLLEAFACGLPAVITDACNAENISTIEHYCKKNLLMLYLKQLLKF